MNYSSQFNVNKITIKFNKLHLFTVGPTSTIINNVVIFYRVELLGVQLCGNIWWCIFKKVLQLKTATHGLSRIIVISRRLQQNQK